MQAVQEFLGEAEERGEIRVLEWPGDCLMEDGGIVGPRDAQDLAACSGQDRVHLAARRPSSSVSRRARTGSAITPPTTRLHHHKIECGSNRRGKSANPANVCGH